MPDAHPLANDWYPGLIPGNVLIDPTAYLGSSYNFARFRSELPVGAHVGRGASLDATTLDVGPRGKITIGEFAMVTSAYLLCDSEIEIGPYTMISWNAVLMDNYRMLPRSVGPRGLESEKPPRPVILGRNVWIGFEACVLPGVTVGDGAIVGARAVVREDVPPSVVVAGDPARIVRRL